MNAPFPRDAGEPDPIDDAVADKIEEIKAIVEGRVHIPVMPKRNDDRVLSLANIVAIVSITAAIAGGIVWLVTMSMTAERKNIEIARAIASSDSNRVYLKAIDRRVEKMERNSNLQTLALCSLIKGEMTGVCQVLRNELNSP